MKKALDPIRYWWIETQLAAPPFVQHVIIPRMHEAKEIVGLLTRPYLPVYQLQGQGQGGPLTVIYIGLDYTKSFLMDLLFVGEPVEQRIGQVPIWQYKKLGDMFSGDMIIVEAAKHLIRRLPRHHAIIFPQNIDHVLDVHGEWADVKKRFRESTRYELRLTRKFGYQYKISRDDQDFETFYNSMYLPNVNRRYGDLSSPMLVKEAYQYFRHGFLFWVTRDGKPVCGSICYPKLGTVQFIIMGVLNGDQQLLKEGAMGALNCLRIQWANQEGYEKVNFLGSGARLTSKLFQYKRKWGGAVSLPPDLHRLIWLYVRNNTPAVSQFLKENPFVIIDENDQLHGLVIVDDPHDVPAETKVEWDNLYVTPGLSSLVIRSVSRFTHEASNNRPPDLVIPILSIQSIQATNSALD